MVCLRNSAVADSGACLPSRTWRVNPIRERQRGLDFLPEAEAALNV